MLDVKRLGEKLDAYLERFKVKEVGICPVKREIYTQCFGKLPLGRPRGARFNFDDRAYDFSLLLARLDEIIRQVTLNCAERGFMLIKIRDDMNNTIDSNQKLFESVMAHGIRKALMASTVIKFSIRHYLCRCRIFSNNFSA